MSGDRKSFLPFVCDRCGGRCWLDTSLIGSIADAGACPYCKQQAGLPRIQPDADGLHHRLVDANEGTLDSLAELAATFLGATLLKPASIQRPAMHLVLKALDDTREYLEDAHAEALDANDTELANAYRYSLNQFKYCILNESTRRGVRYLSDWAVRDAGKDKP
jgi:hypothetical protein